MDTQVCLRRISNEVFHGEDSNGRYTEEFREEAVKQVTEGGLAVDAAARHHQAVSAAGNEMIDPDVTFPPAEEFFYFPSKLVDKGNFFGSEIKSVGGNPIFFAMTSIHQLERFFGLGQARLAEQYFRVIENDTNRKRYYRILYHIFPGRF